MVAERDKIQKALIEALAESENFVCERDCLIVERDALAAENNSLQVERDRMTVRMQLLLDEDVFPKAKVEETVGKDLGAISDAMSRWFSS